MKKLLKKLDNLFPTPWLVEGVEQVRQLYQLVRLFIGIIICLIIFHFYLK